MSGNKFALKIFFQNIYAHIHLAMNLL